VKNKIIDAFEESIRVKKQFIEKYSEQIYEVSRLIAERLSQGNKLILFGNGGSACDASHIAAEFVNRYKMERPALPAIALNTDMAVITSISNDYDYIEIFSKQLKALGNKDDVVIAISTSGNSPNVLKALEVAKAKDITTIGFTGAKGDLFSEKVDYAFKVPSTDTPRIQETHITLAHVICQVTEEILFGIPVANI
jgi:D-sedoheptulose 7-phosphate isomerase